MKARRLPARSALEQLLHQVPQRRPRLLFLPPALLNRLRLLHQLLLQQRKQILLLLLPLKQRRLLLLLLLLRQLNQLPQKLQKQLRSLLQKRRSLRNLPQRPKLHLRRNQQRNPRPLLRLHRRSLLNPQNLPSLKSQTHEAHKASGQARFSRSCKQAFCEQGARGRERHRRGNEENARTSC